MGAAYSGAARYRSVSYVRLAFYAFFRLGMAFKMLWSGRGAGHGHDGELSPFNALMTALAATIGTGNIAGVATAVFTGGPGAIFLDVVYRPGRHGYQIFRMHAQCAFSK